MSQQPPQAGSSSSAALPLEQSSGKQFWTVGTLVYTASGLVVLFVWLLWGDFALSMRERSVGPLIEKFLLKNGATNTVKQLLTATLPTIIALILGPIISYNSDRYRSRWGRRIPFLLIPTPIAGLAMVGIAFSPQMGEALWRAAGNTLAEGQDIHLAASTYTLTVFAVLWTIFEVAVITSGAVMGGLINDVVPRPVLGRFHGLFRAVSLFDGILFNAILFKHAEQHFTLMFALIGLLFGGGFTLMCLKVREGNYPPPPQEPMGDLASAGMLAPVLRFYRAALGYLRECFTQPYYLMLFAMFCLAGLTFSPINSFSYRYAAQLHLPDANYGILIALSYVVSLTIAFPLGMVVDRVHPMRASIVTMALYSLCMLYGALFAHDPNTFSIAFIGHTILSGSYFTCSASLGQQLYPRSKFSQYASAAGIVNALVNLVFPLAMGVALDLTRRNAVAADTGKEEIVFDYHLTFWLGLVISLMALGMLLVIYQRFMRFGGPKGYVAPGDDVSTPSRHEPPKHMFQILSLYLVGALLGIAAGYVLSYLAHPARVAEAGVSLWSFHTLVFENADVRGHTTLCLAIGVIPGALLGGIAGSKWARRLEAEPA